MKRFIRLAAAFFVLALSATGLAQAQSGTLQFSANYFSGAEGGNIVFTVTRTGGSAGAASVNYTVSSGTAMAGFDFNTPPGTLTWGAGDAASKTFSVAATTDAATEGVETVVATLSGATGATLGGLTTAIGYIQETWPPGGAMPAGWTTSPGASAGWAFTNLAGFDADATAIKSGPINFNVRLCTDPTYGAVPCPSATQTTATLTAGMVSFAYKVSTFPGAGYFEFFVNGVLVLQDTGSAGNSAGDSGWNVFSIPITAGTHTLKWQYRPSLPFECNCGDLTGDALADYPQCADTAWLDAVSLPVQLAPATVALSSSANPANAGASVTFTAATSGGAGTRAGTVTFRSDGANITGCVNRTITAGNATCTTNALPGGLRSIQALYSGSTVYYPAVSNALAQTISGPADLQLTLASNPAASPGTNKDIVYTATIANNGGTAALSTVVTHTVPASATLIYASPGCVNNAGAITCSVGTIAIGGSSRVRIVLRRATTGALAATFATTHSLADPTPANNSATANLTLVASPAGVPVPRYRLFSPVTNEHLYTTDLNEYNVLGTFVGTWNQEGTIGQVLNNPGSFGGVTATPYYRLYNTSNAQHHWTTDPNEYYLLGLFPQYVSEGIDGWILPTQGTGSIPLYRLLYPFTVPVSGLHNWTIDLNEYNTLIASFGWVGEGIAGYVIP